MAVRNKANRDARRGDLIASARKVFASKGVANAAVNDIVKAAGVAQGTFYLYFPAKTDVVNAVVDQMAEEMVDSIDKSVASAGPGAVSKFLALRDAVLAVAGDPASWELAEIYHRPENRDVHDRMAERLLPRLVPVVEKIVREGVSEGVFTAENPGVAAWFILGGLHALELAFTDRAGVSAAVADATNCALRALGCTGSAGTGSPQTTP
jgi:AcrR family transcriptional regulator